MQSIHWRRVGALMALLSLLALLGWHARPVSAGPFPQDSTPTGPYITGVGEGATVRSGPGTTYDRIGRIVAGQVAQVLGKAVIGAADAEPVVWLQIVYLGPNDNTGWVWIDNVAFTGQLDTVAVPIIPPTPTRAATATLEFGGIAPTDAPVTVRPPTFTPPSAILRPTLLPVGGVATTGITGSLPPMVVIVVLVVIGGFAGLLGFFQSRR
ncbi:MAG TPA: SH3 domain-containing protein [Anaerolineales bacterium]|nr:SH3 domain-containing protein [Anaerolineales bacterium]HRF48426.1 SH3 domain-containing protein [Anaerolineales bacterium]